MTIIEIMANELGGHNNHTSNYLTLIPDGWAVVPDGMECENFPFGSFEVAEVYGNGVLYVKEGSWVPGAMPEPAPEPKPEPEDETSVWDELDAAYQEGVNSV